MSLAVDASSPTAAIGSGATTVTGAFTPPDNTLLVAFCAGDANNGSLDEDQTVVDSTSTTWTKVVLRNGNGGACVTVHKRRLSGTGSSPGSITATLTDSKGSVAKRIFPRVFVDVATGIAPDIGATAVSGSASVSLTTTVNNSWVWSIALTANAVLTAGTGCTQQDDFGGFDTGDAVQTESQTALTTTSGTSVTNGLSGTATVPHNIAVEIIPGSSSTAPALPPPALRRRPAMPRPPRARVAAALTLPAPVPVEAARRSRPAPARRGRQVIPVRAQVNPPMPAVELVAPRRPKAIPPRRTKVWQAALVPPVAIAPPYVTPARPERIRLPALRRGGRQAPPPWPQQTPPANPDLPLALIRRILRLLVPGRRPRTSVPAALAVVPAAVRRPRAVIPARRVRLRQPLHAVHTVPVRRRPRLTPALPRPRHVAAPLGVAVAPVAPALVPARIRIRQALPVLRRRRMPLLVVTSATCDCTTHRPNTGTTARPGTGTTSRPFTGITSRPCSC